MASSGSSNGDEDDSGASSANEADNQLQSLMLKHAEQPASQSTLYELVERWSRLSNAGLTPSEAHSLLDDVNNLPAEVVKDLNRVYKFFGKASGATANAIRCIKYFAEKDAFVEGETAHVNHILFTLCKALCISDRASYGSLTQNGNMAGCSCIAKTYLMPMGCEHKRRKITRDIWLPSTLCSQCSQCMRCLKLLGFKCTSRKGLNVVQ